MIVLNKFRPLLIVFMSFSLCFIIFQFSYKHFTYSLQEQALNNAKSMVHKIDSILFYAEEANEQALKLALRHHSCDKLAYELRKISAAIPYVRTTNISVNGYINCSSIWGGKLFEDNVDRYISGKLQLMPGSQVDPSHPLIALRTGSDDKAAISGIDAVHIEQSLFSPVLYPHVVYFSLGEGGLDQKGELFSGDPTRKLVGVEQFKSQFFPFSVYVGFSYSSLQNAFWHERKLYITLILLIQLSFLLYYWWQVTRPKPLDEELQRAIKQSEFVPYAQAVVNARTHEVEGIEILVRWQHPIQGVVRPDLFIPQAEESGLIIPITRSVLKETAKQLCTYSSHITKPFHVGINISPQHCYGYELLNECEEFIRTVNQDNIILVLELTEREVLDFSESTKALFFKIKELGCKVAIDDYGTGHSSLANLQKIDVDYIKIDQMFVQGIGKDLISEHLVENTIELANRLSIELIAEGVENKAQQEYLTDRHVSYLQGFLFSRPLPLGRFLQQYCQKHSN
ncbi:EAL domain-containing protein [Vibrio alginolyticus]|nr:EAL domain-containing protein [Vibrio parahaemolyticus]MBM4891711.1 cyclic diguanylate phosphodiesterase [Vibrio parahaemolyticus]WMP11142.1 cyclic diguanylate phosphodiesterase [Vibrio parahaemolyticus]